MTRAGIRKDVAGNRAEHNRAGPGIGLDIPQDVIHFYTAGAGVSHDAAAVFDDADRTASGICVEPTAAVFDRNRP